jgi:hypothetical protein
MHGIGELAVIVNGQRLAGMDYRNRQQDLKKQKCS